MTVVTIGRPSGMAATASETRGQLGRVRERDRPPIVNISNQSRFCQTPIRKMMPMTTKEKMDSCLARSSIASWRGVLFSSTYSLADV